MTFRISILVLVIFVGSFQLSLAQDSQKENDLKDAIAKFYKSIEVADAEARIQLLDDDVMMMPNHWTVIHGKDAVSKSIKRSVEAVFKIKDREVAQMEISGDLAYTVNFYYFTYNDKDSPEQWHKTKNVHIWHRNSSGAWKLAVDIWNSDVPVEQYLEE